MIIRRRIATTATLALLIMLVGTLGYRILEGWPWLDAVYMTVITLTTVGFGEIRPLTDQGQLFTIFVILSGAGVFAYALSSTAEIISSGQLAKFIQWNRRSNLKDHVIVCGYGRVGQFVAAELAREGTPFIIIDRDDAAVDSCQQKGYQVIQGNAASEETLEKAGIARAKALIAAVNSDAENVFIVLTVRSIREDIRIISRSNYEESFAKLQKAGADHVISPYALAGNKMVHTISRPQVSQFIDVVLQSENTELYMEEVDIQPGSPIAGRTLGASRLRNEVGVTVLAIDLPGKKVVTHPEANTPLPVGARLIVIGTREQLDMLNRMVSG